MFLQQRTAWRTPFRIILRSVLRMETNTMRLAKGMTAADKVRENKLRRAAERQGLMLVKSRRRDPRALDFGLFVLVADNAGNRAARHGGQAAVSAFATGHGMTLDQVEQELNKGGRR